MIKKIFGVVLFLAFLVCCYTTYISSNRNRELLVYVDKLESDKKDLLSSIEDFNYEDGRRLVKFKQAIFSESEKISDVKVVSSEFDTLQISSIINEPKLIYRFYQETCVQCVEDELDILKKISDVIGSEHIIIISDFDKMNMLKTIINRKSIPSDYFISKENMMLPIDNDEEKIATFFTLDSNLKTDFVFKTGGEQYFEDPYYQRIIEYFNNNKE